ncbi:MAG: ABC transporter substrate-binding protein [Dehalococcoidales bacterium]|nr:ABC transporter substrate-binding protein [Dehalococcoidales bacterium]
MDWKRLLKVTALVTMTLLIMAMPLFSIGCSGDEEKDDTAATTTTTTEKVDIGTVKIGYSICYTGKAAEKGRPMGDGKLDCFKYINDELGGVNGYQVEVVWRDNGYDSSKATTIVNEFIDSDCLLFTTCSSAMMTASAEIANRAEFPGFAVFSSPALTNPPKHIYAQMPDYGDDWAAFAKYYLDNIWKGSGKPKMALHLLNNSTGSGAKSAAEALADELGIEIVAVEEHTATTISEIESMTRIKALDPDILYISSTPQPTSIIVQNAVELGMFPGMEIACGHASFTSKLVELAGDDAEGVYGVYPTVNWGDDVEAMAKMTEYCEKYHPEDMGNMDYITTWAESLIVAEILSNAIDYCETNKIQLTPQIVEEHGFKALDGYDVGGLHGPVSYTDGDNRLAKSVRVFQVQGGEIVPVTGWVEAPLIPYSFD